VLGELKCAGNKRTKNQKGLGNIRVEQQYQMIVLITYNPNLVSFVVGSPGERKIKN
jgi:hypothetical protein